MYTPKPIFLVEMNCKQTIYYLVEMHAVISKLAVAVKKLSKRNLYLSINLYKLHL